MTSSPSTRAPLRRPLRHPLGLPLWGALVLQLTLWTLLAGCASPNTQGPSRAPTLEVTPALEKSILSALDGEALYTIAGGLKPLSSGFWAKTLPITDLELLEIENQRRALQSLDDAQLAWGVMPYADPHEERRSYHAWVADRAAVAALLRRRADVFAPHGITPATRPAELLAIVERLPRSDRYRCYGLLFGYPEHAVEFFVQADAERDKHPKGIAPRRFVNIPTYQSKTGRFVYAVPKEHEDNAADQALSDAAAPILDAYRKLRARWITEPAQGAFSLLMETKSLADR